MSYSQPHPYTPEQTLRVELINQELSTTGMTAEELNCGFALQSVKEVLANKCTINPEKIIVAMWHKLFGEAAITDIEKRNGFNKSYNKADRELAARICLRLQSPEIRDQNITSASIAVSMGKSPASISQLINGKYNAKPTKHLHDIWALICPAEVEQGKISGELTERKQISIVYGDVRFIPTSTSKLIAMACDQARQRKRFSVFAGQAGLGKTKGIAEYCRHNKEAILIAGSEQTSSTQVLEQLTLALGLSRCPSAYKNMQKIIQALRDTDRLIILDEADKCKPNSLDPLRTISDQAIVGVTLVGNIQLVDKLQTQERYELIASRVCFWPKPIGQITVEDIRTLFLELTEGTVKLAQDDAKWWQWLHKRVEGNARELVENLLPHLLNHTNKNPDTAVDKLLVNGIFSSVLNKPAV
ncbi:AAA family ATPase [Pseudoalteromonas sp. SD03]|jgi:DNA transposition AAA+ family ATPase|uniref:AAA family ATPase n=1 Tax=Pseudoalteromonas sp. SD03 TaxID=3231719 RepID=A0AB39AKW7_9GAMM